MIHFMLDNLRHPTGIFPMLLLEMLVEVIDFYLLISRTWACPIERQTSLFHLIRACFLRDNRIHHRELERSLATTMIFFFTPIIFAAMPTQ